ncbi:MAG: hypothetical protein RLZ97_1190, partial [Verrucomicrobiota bacterium]
GIVKSGFLSGRLVVPRFVLDELQTLAESPTQANRQRAARALESLESLQRGKEVEITIEETAGVAPGETLHTRLLQTAQLLGARVMTTDENLGKIARLRGIEVLSLHNLAEALRPDIVVGEKIRLPLVRPGKDDHQAIGYLSDGTMIVVNHAIERIGTTCDVRVISTLQTTGGTMVFAEVER